ncbi:hypothetical protein CHUAL_005538 [Chamberlinius hualienensis]
MDFLEYGDILQEVRGAMHQGRLKLSATGAVFKNSKTGKVENIQTSDIDTINWQRMCGGFGLRIMLKGGQMHRFGGFKDTDFEKLSKFFLHSKIELTEKDLSLKGWNWGTAKFTGSVLSFDVNNTSAFEIPLLNVSACPTAKNEVTLEFHQNDDAAVSLMELRFHIPTDSGGEMGPVQAFHDNVMQKANIIQATGDAIATFKEVQCLTPRGRYDIKIFPSFVQLHGKTFDYKIPLTTVLRLFLLPHKDQRQMFFVVSVDPPIKQGQTRYHFLILLFTNEEETSLELGLSEREIKEKYEGKIQREMSGPTYEVMSRIMKVLVQRKITVPGNFTGNSGTSAVGCSYKAAAGFMYPLERGFIYVHKPPIHIRFDEVVSVNFARSGGKTRSFDFEVETKSGVVHTFSSIEKEEYGRLYDFISSKRLRVKNRSQMDQPSYKDDLVDSDQEEEPDAYLARVKAEGEERDDDDDSGESSDESFNPGESGTKKPAGEKKPRKPKKERDENRPKRPLSAYFLWLNESREKLKKEYPGLSMTEMTKKAGEKWKELKDKTKWDKLAEVAKKDYEKAMAEYKAGGGGITPAKKTKKGKESESKSPQKTPGAYKSKEYISSSGGDSSDEDTKKKTKVKEDPKSKHKADSDESESEKATSKKKLKKDKEESEEEEEEEEILSTPSASASEKSDSE